MSANCEYYQELMSRMLDGDLLDAETAALREHIRTCPECRALCAAFSSMALSLRDDEMEPPMSIAGSVMSRIRSYEAENTIPDPEPTSEPEPLPLRRASRASRTRRKAPALRSMVVAACLVVVIGVGALATFSGRGGSTMETAEAPAAAFSRTTADSAANEAAEDMEMEKEAGAEPMAEEATAAAPLPEPEEAPMEEAPAAEAPAAQMETYEVQAAAEETGAGVSGATVTGYTLSDPAWVPAGSEAAFEALLTDAGAIPSASFHAFFYLEHDGVIYEFMTDEDEEYLLWRDAAEGFPTLSQSSFDDLWAIFK